MRIILASGSPRRKELLKELDLEFEVITADIDETIDYDKSLYEEIKRLSFDKAYAVFKDHRDSVVIGSDTIVFNNHMVLGKPKNREDAFNMIKTLSNNTHEVITSVTILSSKMSESFNVISKVSVYDMSDDEINAYLDTHESDDKAGAYAIQGIFKKYIKNINGDYYAIMGLPIGEINQRIKKYL